MRIVKFAPALLAALAGLVALPALAQATHSTSLIKPGEAPSLELVYTGDVIGYLEPCG